MNRLFSPITCLLLASGCSPGTLWVDGDREVLRTALVRTEVVDGVAHASLVLSNGLFACDLPDHDDPARAQQALNNLVTAACREGARHLTLQLWREPGGSWTGEYPGLGGGGPADLSRRTPRVADAAWHAVDEAFLVFVDGARVSFPDQEELVLGAADEGVVRIEADRGDHLAGTVHLPEVGVSATFRATRCTGAADQLRLIEASPKYICLTDAR